MAFCGNLGRLSIHMIQEKTEDHLASFFATGVG